MKREDLPFCRKTSGDGDHWGIADYWAVTPSGDDSKDYETGFQYGREIVAFMDQGEDHPHLSEFWSLGSWVL